MAMDELRHMALVRGAPAFRHSLRQVVPQLCDFYYAKLSDGSSFHFWQDKWSARSTSKRSSHNCSAPAWCPPAMVRDCCASTRNPILEGYFVKPEGRVYEYATVLNTVVADKQDTRWLVVGRHYLNSLGCLQVD